MSHKTPTLCKQTNDGRKSKGKIIENKNNPKDCLPTVYVLPPSMVQMSKMPMNNETQHHPCI